MAYLKMCLKDSCLAIPMSNSIYTDHLKPGTLVLIGGNIPGIIVNRVSATKYFVLAQGSVHTVHRDDMVKNDD